MHALCSIDYAGEACISHPPKPMVQILLTLVTLLLYLSLCMMLVTIKRFKISLVEIQTSTSLFILFIYFSHFVLQFIGISSTIFAFSFRNQCCFS